MMIVRYLSALTAPRLTLWCYLIWYLVVLFLYFDPNPLVWLTSLGLSLIVGFALYTNARFQGDKRVELTPWQAFRFFLTPFCVSSFSALVKGRGFILIFSPKLEENLMALGLCAALWGLSRLSRLLVVRSS